MISTTGRQTNMTFTDKMFCWFWIFIGVNFIAAFFIF